MTDISDEDYNEVANESQSTKSSSITKKTTSKKRQAKPKVEAEWTDPEIFKMINCVECLPLLWNAKDEKYKNRVARNSAWNDMSELDFDSKFTDHELQAKWTNLRIQYRSYLSKNQKTKSGQGAEDHITCKWKFFEAMKFVGSTEQEQTSATVSNMVCFSLYKLNLTRFFKPYLLQDTDDAVAQTSTPIPPKRARFSHSTSTAANSTTAAAIVAEGMRSAVSQLKDHRKKEDDELDSFGKYIASEIRSLSDREAACRVRFKVMRCVMDAIEEEKQIFNEDLYVEIHEPLK